MPLARGPSPHGNRPIHCKNLQLSRQASVEFMGSELNLALRRWLGRAGMKEPCGGFVFLAVYVL
jgi:hypothetical protein